MWLPQPPSPCARERQILRRYACGGGQAALGDDNCVVPPQFSSPIPPSFLPVARVSVRGSGLRSCFIARGIAAVVILFANSRSYLSYSSYKSYLRPASPRLACHGRSTRLRTLPPITTATCKPKQPFNDAPTFSHNSHSSQNSHNSQPCVDQLCLHTAEAIKKYLI